jgi:lysophospholipase L1-like esterase
MAGHPIRSFISNSDMQALNSRWLRWAVFLGCFVITLEAAARIDQWVNYGAPVLGMYTYDSALFTTDEFGIRGKAHGAYEKWKLNAFGFRGPEVQLMKERHLLRIVCLGASETFGLYENSGKEWPRQLEDHLRRSGRDVEVINAALAGMSLPQRIRHLEKRLVPFAPDIAVFMLEYGSYAGATPERMQSRARGGRVSPKEPEFVDGLLSFRISGRLKDVLVPKLPMFIQGKLQQWEGTIKLALKQRDLGVKYRSLAHLTPLETAAFEEDLALLADRTAAARIKLVVVVPAMWFTERTMATTYLSWPYVDESWWREAKESFSRRAAQFSEARGIAFVDLSAVVEGREAMYMKDMLHFNDLGAEQAANAIANVLLSGRSGLVASQGVLAVK